MRRRTPFDMIQKRAYRNMRESRTGRLEKFLVGVASGLFLLAVGVIILLVNFQNLASPSVSALTTFFRLPPLALIIGGGRALFGLYWVVINIWLFVFGRRMKKTGR